MTETPQAMALRLMNEIKEGDQSSFTKGEVRAILNHIAVCKVGLEYAPNDSAKGTVSTAGVKRGDVFIAHAIGGKIRPWITLRVDGEAVRALAMSSGDKAPDMVKSECHLWPGSWISTTISSFTLQHATQDVSRPYTNLRHLAQVEAQVGEKYGMQVRPALVGSLGEIVDRVRAAR